MSAFFMPFVNAWRKAKVYFAVQSAFTLLFAKTSFCASTPRAGLQYMDQGRCRLQSLRQAGVHFTLPLCQCMVPSRSAFASQSAFTLLFPKPFFSRRGQKLRYRYWIRGLAEPCLRDNEHTSHPPFVNGWHLRVPFMRGITVALVFA